MTGVGIELSQTKVWTAKNTWEVSSTWFECLEVNRQVTSKDVNSERLIIALGKGGKGNLI